MENLWNLYGDLMEVLWNIDGGIMKKLQNLYGTFVEKQIWRNCGKPTRWKIADWKISKTRYNGVTRETKRKD